MKTLAMKLLLGWLALATPWLTQDNAKVTIRGNLTSPRQSELPIDFNKLKPQLIQQIDLPSMPAPAAIASMTTEQRRAWFDSFRETQSGKEYFAERQRLLDNRINLKST